MIPRPLAAPARATARTARDWHRFARAGYRPFRAVAVSQAFCGSLVTSPLVVPLLLSHGVPAWMTSMVVLLTGLVVPLQAVLPRLVARHGLRRLTLVLALGELRGIPMALAVLVAWAGWLPVPVALALVSACYVAGTTLGMAAGGLLAAWTGLVLPERERRFLVPRLGSLNVLVSTLLLIPAGMVLDAVTSRDVLLVYAAFFAVSAAAAIWGLVGASRYPRPAGPVATVADEAPVPQRLERLLRASWTLNLANGLVPFWALLAVGCLHWSAGYAVTLAGVSSGAAVVAATILGSVLPSLSSSRLLHASLLARAACAFGVLAVLVLDAQTAATILLAVAALDAATDVGVRFAGGELLQRTAPPESIVAHQTRYLFIGNASATAGQALSVAVIAVAPVVPVFGALYAAGGVLRTVAARQLDVADSWRTRPAESTVRA